MSNINGLLLFHYFIICFTFYWLVEGKTAVIFLKTEVDQHNKIYIFFFFFYLQSMIMNEHIDRERDKRSSQCRHLIQRRLKCPGQSKQTLAQEIAFAKDIILLRHAHPRDAAGPQAKREVRREDESMTPLNKGASTSNSAKIRVMNHKDYKAWKVRI